MSGGGDGGVTLGDVVVARLLVCAAVFAFVIGVEGAVTGSCLGAAVAGLWPKGAAWLGRRASTAGGAGG